MLTLPEAAGKQTQMMPVGGVTSGEEGASVSLISQFLPQRMFPQTNGMGGRSEGTLCLRHVSLLTTSGTLTTVRPGPRSATKPSPQTAQSLGRTPKGCCEIKDQLSVSEPLLGGSFNVKEEWGLPSPTPRPI